MPPIKKILKEDIVKKAYEIVSDEGFDNLNARRIAKELNCSVQPLFHNFENMDELKEAVYEKIYDTYKSYLMNSSTKPDPYKQMGLSYIKFAKDYPEFFRIILMQKTDLNAEKFILSDAVGEDTIKNGQKYTGLTYEQQVKFHVKVWIFTHGLATLMATRTTSLTDIEIENLLTESVAEMLIGYKKEKK